VPIAPRDVDPPVHMWATRQAGGSPSLASAPVRQQAKLPYHIVEAPAPTP
jgi:hypothetical protein